MFWLSIEILIYNNKQLQLAEIEFGSCNHHILANFLWSKKHKHSSSSHSLHYFNWYRPRISLVELLIFSLTLILLIWKTGWANNASKWQVGYNLAFKGLMFSQILFLLLLSFKISKAANLVEILIWYCYLTSSSFSCLRLNSAHSIQDS